MIAIQIGANKGFDDFYELVRLKQLDQLILIEPLEVHNESLRRCYKDFQNFEIENVIVTDEDVDNSIIYYHKQDGIEFGNCFELASLNKNHSLNIRSYYDESEIVSKILPSVTLNNLFEKKNLTVIDLLFIDTEGSDEKIIKSIDFDKYTIKEIYYENLHCDINNLRDFLKSKNYQVTPNVLSFGWSDYAKYNL